jgi:hypothetical protein
LGSLFNQLEHFSSWNPTYSKSFSFQNDQSLSDRRKVKILQEPIKNAKDVRKQRRVNANPNNTAVAMKRVEQNIGEMFVKGQQHSFFLPSQIHNLSIRYTTNSYPLYFFDIKIFISQKISDSGRNVFID